MSDNATDEAFAHAVDQMGAASPQYIDAAKAAQAEAARRGRLLPLAEVMVEQNIITRAMRESIEQRLQTRGSGGTKALGQHKPLKKPGESLRQRGEPGTKSAGLARPRTTPSPGTARLASPHRGEALRRVRQEEPVEQQDGPSLAPRQSKKWLYIASGIVAFGLLIAVLALTVKGSPWRKKTEQNEAQTGVSGEVARPVAEQNAGAAQQKISPDGPMSATDTATALGNPAHWRNSMNLLRLLDLQADAMNGLWSFQKGSLLSDTAEYAQLEIPYRPPEEYDFRIVFTRIAGDEEVIQYAVCAGRPWMWQMGAYGDTSLGFQLHGDPENELVWKTAGRCLRTAETHTSILQVRKDGMAAFLDCQLVCQWRSGSAYMKCPERWKLRDETLLGLGASRNKTIFDSVDVLEVTGKGQFARPGEIGAKALETKRKAAATPVPYISLPLLKAEEKAPEAKAPEVKASEVKAPEAKAPEAKAPEAQAVKAKTDATSAAGAKAPDPKPDAK